MNFIERFNYIERAILYFFKKGERDLKLLEKFFYKKSIKIIYYGYELCLKIFSKEFYVVLIRRKIGILYVFIRSTMVYFRSKKKCFVIIFYLSETSRFVYLYFHICILFLKKYIILHYFIIIFYLFYQKLWLPMYLNTHYMIIWDLFVKQ